MWGPQGAGRAEVMGDRWNWAELLPAVKLRMNQDAQEGFFCSQHSAAVGVKGQAKRELGP